MLIKSQHGDDILEHDDIEHIYTLNSKPLTGVTTILNMYPKSPNIIHWQITEAVKYTIDMLNQDTKPTDEFIKQLVKEAPDAYKIELDRAADIGTTVHEYCNKAEQNISMTIDSTLPNNKIIQRCCDQYDEWKAKNKDEIIGLEEVICSPTHWFAGRYDRLAKREGKIVLSDYKTSSGFYITQFIQMAAYSIALEEWTGVVVEDIEIVRFDKKTGSLSTRNLTQLANTVNLSPKTTLKRLKQEFLVLLDSYKFKDRFDRYIRK